MADLRLDNFVICCQKPAECAHKETPFFCEKTETKITRKLFNLFKFSSQGEDIL